MPPRKSVLGGPNRAGPGLQCSGSHGPGEAAIVTNGGSPNRLAHGAARAPLVSLHVIEADGHRRGHRISGGLDSGWRRSSLPVLGRGITPSSLWITLSSPWGLPCHPERSEGSCRDASHPMSRAEQRLAPRLRRASAADAAPSSASCAASSAPGSRPRWRPEPASTGGMPMVAALFSGSDVWRCWLAEGKLAKPLGVVWLQFVEKLPQPGRRARPPRLPHRVLRAGGRPEPGRRHGAARRCARGLRGARDRHGVPVADGAKPSALRPPRVRGTVRDPDAPDLARGGRGTLRSGRDHACGIAPSLHSR